MQEHERKAWHPVVWQQPPIKIEEIKTGAVSFFGDICFNSVISTKLDAVCVVFSLFFLQDAPHKRIIRNIYRFYKETENPVIRKKITEDMLLALPTASKTS